MIDDLKKFIRDYSSRYKFVSELRLPVKDAEHVFSTLADVRTAFRGKFRQSSEPFHRHPVAVALIRVWSGEPYDVDDIDASLHHDTLETFRRDWNIERLCEATSPVACNLVCELTKPELRFYGGDRERRDKAYEIQLWHASVRAIKIKIADGIHNGMTTEFMPLEVQRRTLAIRKRVLLPLARRHDFLPELLEQIVEENELTLSADAECE